MRFLFSWRVVLSLPSQILLTSPTSCSALLTLSLSVIDRTTIYSTTFRSMFMDSARSPELSNMSFVPCSWQDTGNADTPLQFILVSVTAFSLQRRDRPFHLGLTVLYSIRFRCSLELCREHNFTPLITETHVRFAKQAYCKFLLSDSHWLDIFIPRRASGLPLIYL